MTSQTIRGSMTVSQAEANRGPRRLLIAMPVVFIGYAVLVIIEYQFDDEAFTTRQDHVFAVTIPWTKVRGVTEKATAFVLDGRPITASVDKRAFSTSGLAALRALLAEKLGVKAKLRNA